MGFKDYLFDRIVLDKGKGSEAGGVEGEIEPSDAGKQGQHCVLMFTHSKKTLCSFRAWVLPVTNSRLVNSDIMFPKWPAEDSIPIASPI